MGQEELDRQDLDSLNLDSVLRADYENRVSRNVLCVPADDSLLCRLDLLSDSLLGVDVFQALAAKLLVDFFYSFHSANI